MSPRKSLWTFLMSIMLLSFYATSSPALIEGGGEKHQFTKDFMIEDCTFSSTGANLFFILELGFQLVLEGEEDKEEVQVVITVLDDTKPIVAGDLGTITTRVVEEKEWKDGQLIEVSRNFFAICVETNSVFYFGEEVDICDEGLESNGSGGFTCEGEEPSHEGAWRAFEDAEEGDGVNLPGIIMPGTILLGSRYFQEIAPGVAMDRAEIVSMDETVETDLGNLEGCVRTTETTPLEPSSKDTKLYAPDIGLVVDGPLVLTCYGYDDECAFFIPD